ncbi:MAG: methyltransferase domain-containing protein [Methylobacteriaceae bacterium]|nr:methyltransferase domain-containing protein [Methylobacteriaceae bacterium]
MRLLLLAFLCLASVAPARALEPLGPPGRPASAYPPPDRPVAEIISPRWMSDADRDRANEVGQVARLLGIKPGETVADIGAGAGYYTLRLAPMVGPDGRVLAQDVTPAYLAELQRAVASRRLANVSIGLGEAHDPRLPPGSVDVAILIHMYHEIAQPFGLLDNLGPALTGGGRVGIVDADDIPSRHGTPPALLRCELAAAGYRETGFHTLTGGSGYLAIFAAPAPDARPDPAAIRPCRDEATRARR